MVVWTTTELDLTLDLSELELTKDVKDDLIIRDATELDVTTIYLR